MAATETYALRGTVRLKDVTGADVPGVREDGEATRARRLADVMMVLEHHRVEVENRISAAIAQGLAPGIVCKAVFEPEPETPEFDVAVHLTPSMDEVDLPARPIEIEPTVAGALSGWLAERSGTPARYIPVFDVRPADSAEGGQGAPAAIGGRNGAGLAFWVALAVLVAGGGVIWLVLGGAV